MATTGVKPINDDKPKRIFQIHFSYTDTNHAVATIGAETPEEAAEMLTRDALEKVENFNIESIEEMEMPKKIIKAEPKDTEGKVIPFIHPSSNSIH